MNDVPSPSLPTPVSPAATATAQRRGVPAALAGVLAVVLTAVALALAPGAGTSAQAAGSWTSETIAGMNVRLYVPTTAPAIADGRALMVNLHGCVQKCRKCTRRRTHCAQSDQTSGDALSASSATGVLGRSYCVMIPGV